MVDVNTRGNAKLWQRGIGLVSEIGGVDPAVAEALLERADGRVKIAVLMIRLKIDRAEAENRLSAANGFLRRALGE
jgi:N-acetylmuramic acid 6-phosphate etherase